MYFLLLLPFGLSCCVGSLDCHVPLMLVYAPCDVCRVHKLMLNGCVKSSIYLFFRFSLPGMVQEWSITALILLSPLPSTLPPPPVFLRVALHVVARPVRYALFDCAWPGLAWVFGHSPIGFLFFTPGLAWLGLAWLGLAWLGLAWQGIKAELGLEDSALESYYANAKFQSDCGDYVTAAAYLRSYCDITQTPGVSGSGPNGMAALWGRLACEVTTLPKVCRLHSGYCCFRGMRTTRVLCQYGGRY